MPLGQQPADPQSQRRPNPLICMKKTGLYTKMRAFYYLLLFL